MPTVLLIDDDDLVLDILHRTLARAGIAVCPARDGEEALYLLGTNPIDCVLSDIFMPEVDGLTVLHEVKRRAPDVPVIVMSGDPGRIGPDYLGMAERLGAFAVLQKPIDKRELLGAIRRAVGEWSRPVTGSHPQAAQ